MRRIAPPGRTRRRSAVRAHVEHIFAEQKATTGPSLALIAVAKPRAAMYTLIETAKLDTSIYRIFGEVEVGGWRAGGGRPSVAVGFGGAVAGASG